MRNASNTHRSRRRFHRGCSGPRRMTRHKRTLLPTRRCCTSAAGAPPRLPKSDGVANPVAAASSIANGAHPTDGAATATGSVDGADDCDAAAASLVRLWRRRRPRVQAVPPAAAHSPPRGPRRARPLWRRRWGRRAKPAWARRLWWRRRRPRGLCCATRGARWRLRRALATRRPTTRVVVATALTTRRRPHRVASTTKSGTATTGTSSRHHSLSVAMSRRHHSSVAT